ncbi:hypothetical protein MMC29_005037 [Sticta canariensis]|nr:hypothetical protein [Sticta canariensis]
MRCFKVLMNSSFLHLLTLFIHAIFLTLFHDRISAFAAGPDLRFEGPDRSDYPNDRDIQRAFVGVGRSKTVVFADLGSNHATEAQQFAARFGTTWILDAFRSSDERPFVFANGRSARWYNDFIERVTRVWLGAASGTVWLVTSFPNGPRVVPACNLWWSVELPLLKLNEQVRVIIRVNRSNFWMINVYLKKDDDDPFGPKDGDGGKPRLPGGTGGDEFGIGFGIGIGIGIGAGTGLMGGLGPVGGLDVDPGAGPALPSPGLDGSKDETDNQDGVKTDVLGNVIGFVPSLNPPAVTDDQQAMVNIDGAFDAPGIFKRQGNLVCYDWSDAADFPTFPGDPRLTTYSVGIPDPQYYDMANGGMASIQVTQHAKIFPLLKLSDDYKLDIRIVNPANHDQLLGSVVGVDAPQGQPIKVLSLLPYALFAWTGATDDEPLHFRYGEFGPEWDSNDRSPEHRCDFQTWTAGDRTGTCKFKYG